MKDSTPEDSFGRAVGYGFLMSLAFFAPAFFRPSVPCTFIADSISFIAAYAMVRETWHANPRALLILWILGYSLINLFLAYVLAYANLGPMVEKRMIYFELLWINQSFELFGGAFLFCCSIALMFRAYLMRDTNQRTR